MQPENEVRSIKELLQVMLDNQHMFSSGLCAWSLELYYEGLISYKERVSLLYYIQRNAPFFSIFSELWTDGYYWKRGDITPRLKWFNKHINKN